jgi:hypothetical protein
LSSSDWSTFNNKANSLSGVTGYVSQFNSSNTIDTTGLFWNQSNGRLGIGTTTPSNYVNIVGRTASDRPFIVEPPLRNGRFFVESRGSFGCEINATGAPTIRFSNSNPSLTGLSMRAGSIYDNNTLTAAFNVNETLNEVIYRNFGTNPNYRIASMNNLFIEANSNLSFFTNGTVGSMTQRMTINNSGNIAIGLLTPSARLHVSSANTTAGVGAFLVEDGATTPAAIYRIDNDGKVTYRANAISGTTGNQTINTPSGNVNFAAGATSLTVTNSLCTSSSLVFATVRTNDSTAYVKNVVPGAGSFTINLEAAATAETSVGFFIIN